MHIPATVTDGDKRAAGLDGQLQQTQARSDSLSGSIDTSAAFVIGGFDKKLAFRGLLDDVRVYGRELSGDEVGRLAGGNPISAGSRTSRGLGAHLAILRGVHCEGEGY